MTTQEQEAFDIIANQLVRAEQTLRDCEEFVGACRFAHEGGLATLRKDATTLYKQIKAQSLRSSKQLCK